MEKKDYVIVTDSSSNLNSKYQKEYGFEVLAAHYLLDNEDHLVDNDWKELSGSDFYQIMRQGKRITTSQIDEYQVEQLFEKLIQDNKDIICILCCQALSSGILEALRAKETLLAKYPKAKIEIIDSVCACFAQGMLVIEACKLKNQGASYQEVIDYVNQDKENFLETGYANELKYLRQAGRVSATAAFFGDIIGIRPIIIFNSVGYNVAIKKTRGKKMARNECANFIKENFYKDKIKKIYLAHADCLQDVLDLIETIKEVLQDDSIEFEYDYINPAIGASVGPGTIIIGFYGNSASRKFADKKQ